MSTPKAAEHPRQGGKAEAEATRAKALAALEARGQELKTGKAKLLAGKRRVRVGTATVTRVANAEDAGEGEDARGKRQA